MSSFTFTVTKLDGTTFELGSSIVSKAIASSFGCTIVTRGDSPNYDVSNSVADITGQGAGMMVQMTVNGVLRTINKSYVRRIFPTAQGKAYIVLDREQGFNTDEDYSALKDALVAPPGGDPGPVSGNILYVSKNGDNSTAERGNPYKPWSTPWDAKNSAQFVNGDTVVVFPGTYTANSTGSSDDFVSSSRPLLTLSKEDIAYFFYPGAKIIYNGGSSRAVFTSREQGVNNDVRILGHLELEVNGAMRLFDNTENVSRLHFEGHRVTLNQNSVSNAMNTDQMTYLYWKCNYMTITSTGDSPWFGPLRRGPITYCYIDIVDVDIQNMFNVVSYGGFDGDNFTGKVRIERYERFVCNITTNYFYDMRAYTCSASYFEFWCNKLIITGAGAYEEFFRGGGGTTVFDTGTRMLIHAEDAEVSHGALWRDVSGHVNSVDEESGIWITGRWFIGDLVPGTINAFLMFNTANYRLRLDAKMKCTNKPIAEFSTNAPNTLEVTGIYERTENATLFHFTTNGGVAPIFYACTLINAGPNGATITSSVAGRAISVGGCYSSNNTQDANITFTQLHRPV
jgi:hypothetical protein